MGSKQKDDWLKSPKVQNFAEGMTILLYCSMMTIWHTIAYLGIGFHKTRRWIFVPHMTLQLNFECCDSCYAYKIHLLTLWNLAQARKLEGKTATMSYHTAAANILMTIYGGSYIHRQHNYSIITFLCERFHATKELYTELGHKNIRRYTI